MGDGHGVDPNHVFLAFAVLTLAFSAAAIIIAEGCL